MGRLLALDGDEGKPERQLRLVPQRAFLCRFCKGRRHEFFGLGHPPNLHECVGLADERHEGPLQLRHRTRDLERSFVEVEGLLRTTKFDVAVAEQREPTHQGRCVAACFGDPYCLPEIHDSGVRVALQKGDKPKLAAGSICPPGLAELLRQRKRLGPGALRLRRVQVLVCLAFDDQHAKAEPLVVLNDRIIEVSAETFGDFWNRQSRQLSTQSTDFSVESVPAVAATRERLAGFGVKWFRASPDTEPRQAVCFCEEFMRILALCEGRRAHNKREHNTDGADQVKTVARHDSLPRFVRRGAVQSCTTEFELFQDRKL